MIRDYKIIKSIESFSGEYRFLSNFYNCLIEYYGLWYPSVEHAFQAQKTNDKNLRDKFTCKQIATISCSEAKKLGRSLQLREDWDNVKNAIMFDLVERKFRNNKELKKKLIETYPISLEEGNTWHDNYWGYCKCINCKNKQHNNNLGIILMEVRRKLLND